MADPNSSLHSPNVINDPPNINNNNSNTPMNTSSPSTLTHNNEIPNVETNSNSQVSNSSQQQQQQINNQNVRVAAYQHQLYQQQQNNNLTGGMNRSASMSQINQMNQQQLQQRQLQQQQFLRQQAALYGNMNFGGSLLNQQLRQQQQQPQQQQQQNLSSGNVSGSPMMSQSGNLQATGAQFNIQSHLVGSPRQKTSVLPGSQFQRSNSLGQSMQMQGLMGFGSQVRPNGPISYGQQRLNPAQLAQQLAQQSVLSSPQGQTLSRTSSLPYLNSQLPGLTQNGQSALMQNSLAQQQWSKQMPSMTSPGSQALRLHQQRQLMIQQQQQNMPLTSHQLSQFVQQQQPTQQMRNLQQSMGMKLQQQSPEQQQQMVQQLPSINQQQHQQQGPSGQKSLSLTGSQPDATVSGTTTPGGSSSHGTEATNQLLGKRKIQDLVSQVDARGKLDPEVEDLLLEIADDFIDSVTSFACNLAKHRKSSTLESKDVLLHLEKNCRLTIPGYTSEERKSSTNTVQPASDFHMKRLNMICALMDSSRTESQTNNPKDMVGQGIGNLSSTSHMMRPSPSSDQLVAQSASSQMLPQLTRF